MILSGVLEPSFDPWPEVVQALRARFRIVRERPTWLGIRWRPPAEPADPTESLPIRVQRGEAMGLPWVLMLVDVCAADQLPLADALTSNLTLAVGSYALERDRIVLRAALPLTPGSAATMASVIDWLGVEASRRRAAVRATAPDPSVLARLFSD